MPRRGCPDVLAVRLDVDATSCARCCASAPSADEISVVDDQRRLSDLRRGTWRGRRATCSSCRTARTTSPRRETAVGPSSRRRSSRKQGSTRRCGGSRPPSSAPARRGPRIPSCAASAGRPSSRTGATACASAWHGCRRVSLSDARPRHRRRRLHRLALRPAPGGGAATHVVVLDKLTYAGNRANLDGVEHEFHQGDIADPDAVARAAEDCDAIVNFAAETHVDRSILGPAEFILTDVLGTQVLLDHVRHAQHSARARLDGRGLRRHPARRAGVQRGCAAPHVEPVFGVEGRRRAAGVRVRPDVRVDALVTRGANTYGPRQYPEKFLPLFITNALDGQHLPVYGDGRQRREWLHVEDHCDGIELALRRGGGRGLQHQRAGAREPGGREAHPRPDRRQARTSSGTSPTARATTAATPSTRPSCAGSAGRRRTPSTRAGWRRRSSGTARAASGGSRSSRASTAATTTRSTPPGSRSSVAGSPVRPGRAGFERDDGGRLRLLAALWKRSVKPHRASRDLGYRGLVGRSPFGSPPRVGARRRSRAAPCLRPGLPRARLDDDVGEPASTTTARDDHRRRGGARPRRPRLGPRPRDEPVGRLRLREARLELRADPRALLHGHARSGRRRRRPCASCWSRRRRRRSARPSPGRSTDSAGRQAKLDSGCARAQGRRSRSRRGRRCSPRTRSRRPQPISVERQRRTAASSSCRSTASSFR